MGLKLKSRKLLLAGGAILVLAGAGGGAAWFGVLPHVSLNSIPGLGTVLHMVGLGGEEKKEAAAGEHPPELRKTPADGEAQTAEGGHEAATAEAPAEGEHAAEASGEASGHGEAPAESGHGGGHDEVTPGEAPEIYQPPPAASSKIVQGVRAIVIAQDELGQGDASAGKRQRQLLIETGSIIANTPPDSLSRSEVYAVATFVLSGGSPAVARHAMKSKRLSPGMQALLKGSAEYVEGKLDEAAQTLAEMPPQIMPPQLEARLALMRAQLPGALTDAQRAELLDVAATKLPGSLVEEAALRRLLYVSVQAEDKHRFISSISRYLRRYPKSLYAQGTDAAILSGVMKLMKSKSSLTETELDQLLLKLDRRRRSDLLGALAIAAVRQANVKLCLFATSRQRHLVQEATPADMRRHLYELACQAVSSRGAVLDKLKSLNTEGFSPEEMELYNRVLLLSSSIAKEPRNPLDSEVKPVPVTPDAEADKLAASVAQQLRDTNTLMERASQ